MCSPRWWAVRPVSQRHSEQLWSVGGAEGGSHWWWSPSWCRYFCSKEPGAGSSTWPDLVLDIIQGKLLLICCYLSVTESRWLCHDLAILRLITDHQHSLSHLTNTFWKQGTPNVSVTCVMDRNQVCNIIDRYYIIMRKVRIQNIWETASEWDSLPSSSRTGTK